MNRSYFLGLDLGTSATKAILLRQDGTVISTGKADYPLDRPREGWAEQNPDDWWTGVKQATLDAVTGFKDKQGIKSLAISGQMHGSVFLNDSGSVIRPPILWNDTRTSKQCRDMEDRVGFTTLKEEVGNPILEGFTAPKLLWLRENEPDNYTNSDLSPPSNRLQLVPVNSGS